MLGWLFLILLVSALAFIIGKGGHDEKLVLAGLVAAAVLTFVNHRLLAGSFAEFQPLLFAGELALLGLFAWVAFRSDRFWPLPFTALQAATVLSVIAPLFGEGLVSYALGVTQGIWAYPQILILVLATIRGQRRARSRQLNSP